MKDKLDGKIMTQFAALRPKAYSYLTDDNNKNKITKDTNKCVIKQKLKPKDYGVNIKNFLIFFIGCPRLVHGM